MLDEIRCYAQRLLNPFRGVINCISYQSAEAVTMDGVNWDIYVANDELKHDLESKRSIQISDIRYGHWSLKTGLKRGPIFPSDEFKRLENTGAIVYEYLLRAYQRIPFSFADKNELWLIDTQQRPLALLNSAVYEKDMADDQIIDWRAGQVCRQEFVSSVNQSLNLTDGNMSVAGEYLCKYINQRAGENAQAQWFRRDIDRSIGLEGVGFDSALHGRVLANELFPEFEISLLDHDATHFRLIEEFIQWQAPWRLLLETLSSEQRYAFEQHARRRALEVDKQYRLYPQIIDATAIKAARVEAILRQTLPESRAKEDVMSPFYIEINDVP